ncbi:nucleolar protein dao-5 [Ostrinia furnacalis]|uniref:nucleolar protein dao-5 n=1 Tax=Ostrinia furnacalis TaxID=93504 RepID=UPI00103BAD6C|nr:nucleolar protein dao-5 [Ostrinia furnacalis]XP_028179365.1 nucleolar protein dao-5 [Ostrinia furnacalis]
MQLILETETSADINLKMATIEESLDTTLKDSIESLKNDICNGNKENIEGQKNIITSEPDTHDEELKENSEDLPELPSTAKNTSSELETNNEQPEVASTTEKTSPENGDLDLKTEEKGENNVNSYEKSHSNGITTEDNFNGDKQKCEENCAPVKMDTEEDNIIVNGFDKEEVEDISLSSKKETVEDAECVKLENDVELQKALDVLETEMKVDSVNNDAETINSDDSVKIIETKTSEILDDVDEDISEMALEVDKTISEMKMQIDDDILDNISPDENVSEDDILINEDESDNVSLKKDDTSSVVQAESKCDVAVSPKNIVDLNTAKDNKKASDDKLVVESEKSETVPEVVDEKTSNEVPEISKEVETNADIEKPDDTPEPVASVAANTKVDEVQIDDDVIQIDSEQDSEVLESSKETVNDVATEPEKVVKSVSEIVAENDKIIKDADSSVTVAKESTENESVKIDCDVVDEIVQGLDEKVEVLDVDEIKEVSKVDEQPQKINESDDVTQTVKAEETKKSTVLKLSNTLDILSDDDEDLAPQAPKEPAKDQKTAETTPMEKQCINIEDDDDIMLIDDTEVSKDTKAESAQPMETEVTKEDKPTECTIDLENGESIETTKIEDVVDEVQKDATEPISEVKAPSKELDVSESITEPNVEDKKPAKPLLPENFLKSCKKNLADMTRDELEEFCVAKIVESIVDRSNMGEIKRMLKSMSQSIDEYKKKSLMLCKQNRDLQLVLKSIQEEQKKRPGSAITPLKITRSVGMQVLMTEKSQGGKKKPPNSNTTQPPPPTPNRNPRTPTPSLRPQKPASTQPIPVPRLVPAAANPVAKSPIAQSSPVKPQFPNGARMSPPVQKAEKRPHNRVQSVTVDLTDDEPPAKVTPRSSPAPPVRLVSPQNLLASRPQLNQSINSPRKVYIPISGPQGQIRPGQTIMLKSVPAPGPRQRCNIPNLTRAPAPNVVRTRVQTRHPAPLPDAMKQYQPPNWKALPPAPDLKLSKVENGIVISWKIEGYQVDSYEEIASYQLYAYQETSSPPSTALWKKIGDVKALPLPMACTLTQFMAGFKYYFAVRAVDVRSRLGPFSLPGSILLLNKM